MRLINPKLDILRQYGYSRYCNSEKSDNIAAALISLTIFIVIGVLAAYGILD